MPLSEELESMANMMAKMMLGPSVWLNEYQTDVRAYLERWPKARLSLVAWSRSRGPLATTGASSMRTGTSYQHSNGVECDALTYAPMHTCTSAKISLNT